MYSEGIITKEHRVLVVPLLLAQETVEIPSEYLYVRQ
jgi:hypothetical protein